MAATSAVALAGVTAIGAYLNGKYHIAQDLRAKRRRKQAVDYYAGLGTFPSPHPPTHTHTKWSTIIFFIFQYMHTFLHKGRIPNKKLDRAKKVETYPAKT